MINLNTGIIPETIIDSSGTFKVYDTKPFILTDIKGNSFVHTQLVQNGNFANGTTGWNPTYGTITATNNVMSYEITTVGNELQNRISKSPFVSLVKNSKYLLTLIAKATETPTTVYATCYSPTLSMSVVNAVVIGSNVVNTEKLISAIITPTESATDCDLRISFGNSSKQVGDVFEISKVNVLNLTKDFGAGNEPTTYDQAVSMYASKGIDITNYVEYTQGTLIDSKPVKLVSRGYNAFDEEFEQGGISASNGIPFSSSSYFRTVNFAKVKGGSSYTLENNVGLTLQGINGFILFYDIDKQFISSTNIYTSTPYPVNVNIPNNAVYVKACWSTPLISNAKICFHLTGSRTGYAPYKAPIEYPITTEVLRSAGSVQDSATSKKIGSVDLGTLTWDYNTNQQRFYTIGLSSLIKTITYVDVVGNLLCSKYQKSNLFDTLPSKDTDNLIATYNGNVYVKDTSAGTDAVAFKSAMSGVILNYELATPTEQTATLPTDIEIEKGGSLEVVYEKPYSCTSDFVGKLYMQRL